MWKRSDPRSSIRIPYACGSYRCPSEECRTFAAHLDFARIHEAMTRPGLDPMGWVFLVLTLDRQGTYSGRRPWANEQEAFRDLQRLSQGFLRNVRKQQRARGWRVTGNEWVGTVESHRSGWPHLNLAIYSPELAAELRRDEQTLAELGATERDRQLVRGWLKRVVLADVSMGREHMVMTPDGPESRTVMASWGIESTAEAARNRDALAGYIVKLSSEAGQVDRHGVARTVGEVAKMCQAPSNARMKLRRLRAGKGFLPPRRKDPEWTGVLIRRQKAKAVEGVAAGMWNEGADWECNPAHDPTKVAGTTPEYIAAVAVAVQNELELLLEEEAEAVRRYRSGRARRVELRPAKVPIHFVGRERQPDARDLSPDADDPTAAFVFRPAKCRPEDEHRRVGGG